MMAPLFFLLAIFMAAPILALPAEMKPDHNLDLWSTLDTPEYTVTLKPGPGLPSLRDLNITLAQLRAGQPATTMEYLDEHAAQAGSDPANLVEPGRIQKREATCFFHINQLAPRDLVYDCINYLHKLPGHCAVKRQRELYCETTKLAKETGKYHTVQVYGTAEWPLGWNNGEENSCPGVAWAVQKIVRECYYTHPTLMQVIASGDEYAHNNKKIRVSLIGDIPTGN